MTKSGQKTKTPRGRAFSRSNRGRPGRQKGARNHKTIMEELAKQRHHVKQGGEERIVTTVELALLTLQRHALAGNVRAAIALDQLRASKFPPQDDNVGLMVVPETLSEEEWLRRAEIENKYKKPPPET